jgi:hypothetical protein
MKFLLIFVLAGIAALSYFKGPLIVFNMGDAPAQMQTAAQPKALIINPPTVPMQLAPARAPEPSVAPDEPMNVYKCMIQGRAVYSRTPCTVNSSVVSNRVTVVPHVQPTAQVAQSVSYAAPQAQAAPMPAEPPAFTKCAAYRQNVEQTQKAMQYSNQYNNASLHQQLRNAQSQLDDCEFASR